LAVGRAEIKRGFDQQAELEAVLRQPTAYIAPRIFDGFDWHENSALLERDGRVLGIVRRGELPADAATVDLAEGLIAPGFVDLQVNGGGGVLFNNDRSLDAVRTICEAHARYGTTALLVTLITDVSEATDDALRVGRAARGTVPGFLGLHLEGPHLSVARKGTHAAELIRSMDASDLARLISADIGPLMVTVAPESVTREQVFALAAAGIHVSLGHTDCSYQTAMEYFGSGATLATHLFNAMSQMGNREPGLVGAVLDSEHVHAGLIADGIHVHPTTIRAALAAKRGPAHIHLVTDSMSQTGTDLTEFSLNGRTVYRSEGALRLADGTLAGADLDMIDAVTFAAGQVGLTESLRMASLYPARAVGIHSEYGNLRPGARSDFVHLHGETVVQGTWIAGIGAY